MTQVWLRLDRVGAERPVNGERRAHGLPQRHQVDRVVTRPPGCVRPGRLEQGGRAYPKSAGERVIGLQAGVSAALDLLDHAEAEPGLVGELFLGQASGQSVVADAATGEVPWCVGAVGHTYSVLTSTLRTVRLRPCGVRG